MRFKNLIFTIGILLFLYPTISDWWNSFHQSQVIDSYMVRTEQMKPEECGAFLKEAVEYNALLAEEGFMTLLSDEKKKEYDSVLDMYPDGMMGYILIPAVDCRLPVYHGTEEAVLQIGVGHMEGTSFPVKGKSSHCILSGHRGLPSASLFTGLDRLEKGDLFCLRVLNEELWYEIYQIQTVLPEDTQELRIEKDKEICTLVTCTPYGINTHRLLISGQRIEKRENTIVKQRVENITEGELRMRVFQLAKWSVLCLLIGLFWLSSGKESYACKADTDSVNINTYEMNHPERLDDYEIVIQYPFQNVEFKLYEFQGDDKRKEEGFFEVPPFDIKDYENKKPLQIQMTDREGMACFSFIKKGQYVVIGSFHEKEGVFYRPVSVGIDVPYANNPTIKKIIVKPKYEKLHEKNESDNPESEKTEPVLPQTGQLWMPVILLFLGSLVCFFMSMMKRN